MKAFELIKKYTPCFLKAVNSYKGFQYTFWVIGCWILQYPKTFKDGRLVQEGDEVTQDEADQILEDHLAEFELPAGDWSENQKEALLSIMHFIQKELGRNLRFVKQSKPETWRRHELSGKR